MIKSKKNKRNKRGGDSVSSTVTTNNSSTTPSSSDNGVMGWFSNAWNTTKKTSEGLMNQAQTAISPKPTTTTTTTTSTPDTSSSSSSPITSSTMSSIQGGKRTRRKRGRGYAKVSGLNVAKPTYYLTGGKKRTKRYKKGSRK